MSFWRQWRPNVKLNTNICQFQFLSTDTNLITMFRISWIPIPFTLLRCVFKHLLRFRQINCKSSPLSLSIQHRRRSALELNSLYRCLKDKERKQFFKSPILFNQQSYITQWLQLGETSGPINYHDLWFAKNRKLENYFIFANHKSPHKAKSSCNCFVGSLKIEVHGTNIIINRR